MRYTPTGRLASLADATSSATPRKRVPRIEGRKQRLVDGDLDRQDAAERRADERGARREAGAQAGLGEGGGLGPAELGIQVEVPPRATGIPGKADMPLSAIVSAVADKTIVYVGERHDRYGDHLAQLEVIQGLHERHHELAIGMEMFQGRYQKALDDYITGTVDEETFLRKVHYFTSWGFNYFLYRYILLYARNEKVPVIGLNIPRELVSNVARHGLAHLSEEERALLPKEMDGADEGYRERLQRAFDMHQMEMPGGIFLTRSSIQTWQEGWKKPPFGSGIQTIPW